MTNEFRTAAIIILILFFVGLAWSRYQTKKQQSDSVVKWPIFVCVALGFAISLQGAISRGVFQGGEAVGQAALPVSVTVQNEGVADFDITSASLVEISDTIEHGLQQKISNNYNNIDQSAIGLVDVTSRYIEQGNAKLGLIRVHLGDHAPIAQIIGISQSHMVRVICQIDGDADVPISAGACDQKVREVFGVSLSGRSDLDV